MRFLLYNIRYGTWEKMPKMHGRGYLGRTTRHVESIIGFIESVDADIIGLLEVDAGSYRFRGHNQAHYIADRLGHYHSYQRKYGEASVIRRLPLMKNQGNAFIVRDRIHNEQFHYFNRGAKRLVIELQLEHLDVFLVHLALSFRARHAQLEELVSLVNARSAPCIVAGDFNLMRGRQELRWFMKQTGLADACQKHIPTFPSWAPRKQLDYILHSDKIRVAHIAAPWADYSDHLPLVCDFEVQK